MYEVVDIRKVWRQVMPGVMEIWGNLRWKEWIPEDVYAACVSGDAACFVEEDREPDAEVISFSIVRIDSKIYTGEKVLFIWLSWSNSNESAKTASVKADQLAKEQGCSAVEFSTFSEKLVQYASEFGYSDVMYTVRKELSS